MGDLEPQLQHNRERYIKYNRVKLIVCVIGVVVGTAVMVGAPEDKTEIGLIFVLAAVGAVMVYCEVRRVLIYRKDLLERGQGR